MNKLEVSLEILKLMTSNDSLRELAADEKLDKLLASFERIYKKVSRIEAENQPDSEVETFEERTLEALGMDLVDINDSQLHQQFKGKLDDGGSKGKRTGGNPEPKGKGSSDS